MCIRDSTGALFIQKLFVTIGKGAIGNPGNLGQQHRGAGLTVGLDGFLSDIPEDLGGPILRQLEIEQGGSVIDEPGIGLLYTSRCVEETASRSTA